MLSSLPVALVSVLVDVHEIEKYLFMLKLVRVWLEHGNQSNAMQFSCFNHETVTRFLLFFVVREPHVNGPFIELQYGARCGNLKQPYSGEGNTNATAAQVELYSVGSVFAVIS